MSSVVYFPVLKQSDKYIPGGKIDILDPVSTNPIDVFVYNATTDTYVVSTNPVYLTGEGRPAQTYFVKQLAYLRLYEYLGDFSDPRIDDDTENWHFVREWFNSLDLDKGTSENLDVYGLYGLMDADVSLGSVDVIGYWTDSDCEKRTYIWDSTCQAEPDQGYVVASNSSEIGRWILKFDGEFLPSTYYGVYPGHEENINALVTYPDTVGTSEFKTAPGVYFHRGSYIQRESALVTTKKLMLDGDTHFICDIQCDCVKVIGSVNGAPIADFYFNDHNTEAHSSWFRSVAAFFACNAGKFIFDKDNYFYNRVLSRSTELSNVVIEGSNDLGTITYSSGAYLRINKCTILGENLWTKNDYVYFSNMEFCDKWFNIYGATDFDFDNKILCRSHALNRIELCNFSNALVYILAKRANGDTTIDLDGRILSSVNLGGFTKIRNVICDSLSVGSTGQDVDFVNVKAGSVSIACRYLSVYDSEITFPSEPNITAMWANDSRVFGSYKFTSNNKQYIFDNCYVGISFDRATDNVTDESLLQFLKCEFQENVILYSKRLVLDSCIIHNNGIKVYPYKDNQNKYRMYCKFINNSFDTTVPIEFTKFDLLNGAYQDDVYEIIATWEICNNLFVGNNEGLRCRYWQHRAGNNYNKTFIAGNGNSITYYGNKGNCPKETARGMTITSNRTYTTLDMGSYKIYKYSQSNTRLMPSEQASSSWPRGYFFGCRNENGTLMKYYSWVNSPYNSLTYDMFIQSLWYLYHTSEDEVVNNGDFFAMSIMLYNDYLRIVQRGDGDRNDGIIGKVI